MPPRAGVNRAVVIAGLGRFRKRPGASCHGDVESRHCGQRRDRLELFVIVSDRADQEPRSVTPFTAAYYFNDASMGTRHSSGRTSRRYSLQRECQAVGEGAGLSLRSSF